MTRRARRPYFSPTDQTALFVALDDARRHVIKCGSAERYGSPRHELCGAITHAIDALAEDMTGNRQYFWLQAHGSAAPPNTWQADRPKPKI